MCIPSLAVLVVLVALVILIVLLVLIVLVVLGVVYAPRTNNMTLKMCILSGTHPDQMVCMCVVPQKYWTHFRFSENLFVVRQLSLVTEQHIQEHFMHAVNS